MRCELTDLARRVVDMATEWQIDLRELEAVVLISDNNLLTVTVYHSCFGVSESVSFRVDDPDIVSDEICEAIFNALGNPAAAFAATIVAMAA